MTNPRDESEPGDEMTLDEILAMYNEGSSSKGDTLSQLAKAAADCGVEDTLQALPAPWRQEVEQWILDIYDNDVDSEDFLSFGDPAPDLRLRRQRIDTLREWIRDKKPRLASEVTMIEEVKHIIESYKQGFHRKGHIYTDLLYLMPTYGVQAVLDSLPSDLRVDFHSWLAANYDNDCPPEDFIAFGLTEEELEIKDDPILLVRDWLRGNAPSK